MIDENKTFEKYGYYSTDLTKYSHRKVWRICNNCKIGKWIPFNNCRDICLNCSRKLHTISEEHRKKLIAARTHKPLSDIHKFKISESNKGKHHSEKSIKRMSISKLGIKNPMYGKFGKDNPMYGKFGKDHPTWKGGIQKARRRVKAKRKKYLDPNPIELNKDFKGSHGHHINFKYIINIPAKLHKSISHRQTDDKGMKEINRVAFKYLYNNKENIILDEETIYFINLECYNK